jgi:hypothetical protein
MSTTLQTIEPDEPTVTANSHPPTRNTEPSRPVGAIAGSTTPGDTEAGTVLSPARVLTHTHRLCVQRPRRGIPSGATLQAGFPEGHIFLFHTDQSAHPVVLFVLYLFRIAAIATYILCGFFTDNYVVSVRLLLSLICRQPFIFTAHRL